MPNDNDGRSAPRDVSRRHLFKQVGLAGAAAAVTATAPGVITAAAQPAPAAEPTTTAAAPRPPAEIPTTPLAAPRLEALETLTAAEADTLEAIAADGAQHLVHPRPGLRRAAGSAGIDIAAAAAPAPAGFALANSP
jgi:hypothetical protein